MNIMCWCMYRKMDLPGKIQLLGITELSEYFVLFYVQEDAREDASARYNGTICILCTALYVYVQEGG